MRLPASLEYAVLKALVGSRPSCEALTSDISIATKLDRGQAQAKACCGSYALFSLGSRILDFGCGEGWSTVWLAQSLPTARAIGCDIQLNLSTETSEYCSARGVRVTYVASSKTLESRSFDSILSHDAFEHFEEPGEILAEWARLLMPNGRVFLKFGPLWGAPLGMHMSGTIARRKLPWLHLIFSEQIVMRLWSELVGVSPPLTQYSQRPGGMNQMTTAKFKELIADSPFIIEGYEVERVRKVWKISTLGLESLMLRISKTRSLFEESLWCVLRLPSSCSAPQFGQTLRGPELDPERQPEMAEFPRKADGRRVFTVDFKRETVARIVSSEKTLAELSRELGISRASCGTG